MKKMMLLFKVNFEKAFDSVSWRYLDFMLCNLGFGLTWRSWIKACLESSQTSILVKGSPTSEFNVRRGLRQEDPLSLFLFIIIMEGLHVELSDLVRNGLILGINIGSSDINLTSSLKINIHKYSIYGIGVSSEDVHLMKSITGCSAGSFPFTYLGLPIGSNMSLTTNWKLLVDKFYSKLSSWKANLLSYGGRLTLIKSVMGSLGIYFLSLFKAPSTVLKTLENTRGLAIGSLKSFNLALLHKWRWQFYSNPDSLWVKVIRALHGRECGFDHNGSKYNGLWSKIVRTSNYLHSSSILPMDSIRFQVGCGSLIRFWKDIWLGNSPLYIRFNRLFRLECEKDCLVMNRISDGQWEWNWSRSILGVRNFTHLNHMLAEISQIEVSEDMDKCTWSLAQDGMFSVGALRRLIDDHTLPSLDTKTAWDKSFPRKVNIFMWRLKLDRLPNQLNLSSRGIEILEISCPSCNGNVESNDHIFFQMLFF
ncbi:RNA-directed DNA polymerase, eukaryota, reverse transcriptase zinc-binding domain protein [Tanacetum coccineum]